MASITAKIESAVINKGVLTIISVISVKNTGTFHYESNNEVEHIETLDSVGGTIPSADLAEAIGADNLNEISCALVDAVKSKWSDVDAMIADAKSTSINAAKARLEKAIIEYQCLVGIWSVSTTEENDRLMLDWEAEESNPAVEAMESDEAWTQWGGYAIIKAAGLDEPCNGTGDAYQRHGVNMVSQSVAWTF